MKRIQVRATKYCKHHVSLVNIPRCNVMHAGHAHPKSCPLTLPDWLLYWSNVFAFAFLSLHISRHKALA
jgi:hypothetical protein